VWVIVIIDDDDAMQGVLRDHLEDAYEIIATGDPERAITAVLQLIPDAVLFDWMTLKFSAFEICQTLNALSFTQRIPIFIVSGEPERSTGFSAGISVQPDTLKTS
jgi:DNA-binding response OmpR family regulator